MLAPPPLPSALPPYVAACPGDPASLAVGLETLSRNWRSATWAACMRGMSGCR